MRNQPETIKDLLAFWRSKFSERTSANSEEIAGVMVGTGLAGVTFDSCYESDKDFAELCDLASNLEWSNSQDIDADWRRADELLTILEKRYV